MPHIRAIKLENRDDTVIIDAASQRNLELTVNINGNRDNTLLAILDNTKNAMGSRLLARWLLRPLRHQGIITARQQAIACLLEGNGYERFQEHLAKMGDIERILTRIALKTARPRDLATLRDTLILLPEIKVALPGDVDSNLLTTLLAKIHDFSELQETLKIAIVECPPVILRDGGVIAQSYDQELDELRNLSIDCSQYLVELEAREKQRTGINSLKVGFNRVHGFYIEISRGQSDSAPIDYIRRQTIKNAERYITSELKAFEEKVLSSQSKALAREKILYELLLERILKELSLLQDMATAIAEIDVLCNLAERAVSLNFNCPTLSENSGIEIIKGRHPVIEQVNKNPFIPNDLSLNDQRKMLIITGPNMGGKSTYMRQTALIVLLAYIGSYVPAQSATIGPIHRIFTRIGAADDLASGKSTFMVEMIETANILHNATASSLILLDEIGRGTSTFDGLSLAWACTAFIAEKINAFTLFATHYFEMTALPQSYSKMQNMHISAMEYKDKIIFLHTIKPGPANQSYGLQVAQLAGVPREVIKMAKAKLVLLENSQQDKQFPQQLNLFQQTTNQEITSKLESIEPDKLSPREALEILYELKALHDNSKT